MKTGMTRVTIKLTPEKLAQAESIQRNIKRIKKTRILLKDLMDCIFEEGLNKLLKEFPDEILDGTASAENLPLDFETHGFE